MKKAAVPSILVAVMLLALVVTAEAQQPKKVFRMGYLSSFDPVTDPRIQGIRQRLRELGYIEGQNITIEYRNSEGKLDRLAEFAAELVRLKVDVIVVSGGNPQIRTVMNTTKTIPIVMAGQGTDPVAGGPD
jgi:putative ABC transport system substrate-binding protein